ncbi:hypothetical protein [uncultured Tateyamaria sp.]|uniref:hypothetical protein n=1 Tax=uncultured Tateyamaria sp. TaxID=455651 RepID=UPI00260EA717|nr:hypothetical protein [uncultured Tateyamaria sp.]
MKADQTVTATTAHRLIIAANPNTVGMITFSIFSFLSKQTGETREWWPAVHSAEVIPAAMEWNWA